MSTTIKNSYGTAGVAITITLNSLANTTGTTGRESTAVDNTTNLYLDALVQVIVKIPNSGSIGNEYTAHVYAYGTADATTPNWPDTVTGSDAGITLTSPTQLRLLGIISCPANNATYKSFPMSVAQAFGGILPAKWGIVVLNKTNITWDSTGNSAFYQGLYATSV